VKTYTTDPKGVKILSRIREIVALPDADAWFKETINGFTATRLPSR
jgi:hypothetical protein